jgi:hypothetical protein
MLHNVAINHSEVFPTVWLNAVYGYFDIWMNIFISIGAYVMRHLHCVMIYVVCTSWFSVGHECLTNSVIKF